MANILLRFTGSLVDDEGVRANTHQYALIPEATTLTQLVTTLTNWANAIDAITDGGWQRLEGAVHLDPNALGLPTAATGSEEAGESGEFQYNLTGSSFVWTAVVPTLSEAVVAGNSIDITNTDIIAYNTLLTTALFTTGAYCSPDKLVLNSRKATFLGTRKHRRQQHAKSYQLG